MELLFGNEIILSIEEIDNFRKNKEENQDYQGRYAGYKITTNHYTYHILISAEQCCCERWGYITTNESLAEFIGSRLISFTIVDTDNKISGDFTKSIGVDIEEPNVQFVHFQTTEGLLELAVYNSHNGFYGHDILILKNNIILGERYL